MPVGAPSPDSRRDWPPRASDSALKVGDLRVEAGVAFGHVGQELVSADRAGPGVGQAALGQSLPETRGGATHRAGPPRRSRGRRVVRPERPSSSSRPKRRCRRDPSTTGACGTSRPTPSSNRRPTAYGQKQPHMTSPDQGNNDTHDVKDTPRKMSRTEPQMFRFDSSRRTHLPEEPEGRPSRQRLRTRRTQRVTMRGPGGGPVVCLAGWRMPACRGVGLRSWGGAGAEL